MHQKRLEMGSITLENPQNRSESPKIYLFRTKIAQISQKNPRFETSGLDLMEANTVDAPRKWDLGFKLCLESRFSCSTNRFLRNFCKFLHFIQ